jgi:predicted ATPase
MIETLAVSGYRSLRDLRVGLRRGSVITGANGVGKSSLYRALRLLSDVAQGRVVAALAQEGGLASTLWAGPEAIGRSVRAGVHPVEGTRRKGPVSLKLGFNGEDVGFAIDLGLPIVGDSAFSRDPEIKAEAVWAGGKLARSTLYAARNGPSARLLSESGAWRRVEPPLAPYDSMMTHASGGRDGFELLALRERMQAWRFYDHLRADSDAPARRRRLGTRCMALSGEGGDLAAALQTILEIGDAPALSQAIEDAFPGSRVEIDVDEAGFFETRLRQQGLLRPLSAAELSEGTLRFLMLGAALLPARAPELIVLNEPETSLHRDLIGPLARLVASAARRSQIILVSHAAALVEALEEEGFSTIELEKSFGETRARDHDPPPWAWPDR